MQERLFNRKRIRRNKAASLRFPHDNFLHRYIETSLFEKLLCFPQEFDRILTLGRFTNQFYERLAQRYPQSSILKTDCVSSSSFLNMICEEDRLPFPEKTFDLVLSNLTFHLYDVPQTLLAESYRVLRTKGLYLNTFFAGKTLFELRSVLMDQEIKQTKGAGQRVIPMIDAQSAASLLQHSLFKEPVTESETITVSFATLSRLHQYIKSFGEQSPLLTLSPPLSKSVVQNLESNYLKYYPSPESGLCATFELLSYTGWKE